MARLHQWWEAWWKDPERSVAQKDSGGAGQDGGGAAGGVGCGVAVRQVS